MLDGGAGVLGLDVRKGVRAAGVAQQQRVALGEVAGVFRARAHAHQAPVGVGAFARRDALGDDGAAGVLAQVDHLGAGVRLLGVAGQRHRVELAHGVVAAQHHGRVLPGDRRAGFHLGPADLGVVVGDAALGHEVVDAALAVLVAGVPVLHRGVLDLGAGQGHQLHHRRVQLVLIALRRGAAFQVAHVAALVGDDQGALELAGVGLVDAEVGGQLHGAAYALGDVNKGAVGEYRRVEAGEEVVALGHHGAQVLLDQFRVLVHRLGDRAEDHARLRQLGLEGGAHGDRVEHRVHGHPGEHFLLVQRDTQLLVGVQQFRVHLVQALRPVLHALGRGVVGDGVQVHRRVGDVGPVGLGHLQPVAIGVQTPLQQPFRFAFLGGNDADHVLVQARRQGVGLHQGGETRLVLGADHFVEFGLRAHN